jgi:hypothetical protein
MFTEKEWNYRVFVIDNWHADKNTDQLTNKDLKFCCKHKSGYNFVSRFFVNRNGNGDPILLFFRKENSKDAWHQRARPVAHQGMVFDILYRAHTDGHLKARALFNKLKYLWQNVGFPLCKTFVSLCPTCVVDKPKVKPSVGSAKPIESFAYRDRSQADLVDFRTAPALLYPEDPNSPIVRWLLVVKDHFTRLVYLRALMAKSAHQVARELDHHFSFVGYPIVFQSDNGGEFKSEVLRVLKDMNPNMYTLRGRARTPRDQGSVEIANKWVKIILAAAVFWKRQQLPLEDVEGRKRITWATELGTAMRTINSNHGNGAGQASPYDVVFGMRFDEPLICNDLTDDDCNAPVPTADNVRGQLQQDLISKLERLGELGASSPYSESPLSTDLAANAANADIVEKFSSILSNSNFVKSCSNAFGFPTADDEFNDVMNQLGTDSFQQDTKPAALPSSSLKRPSNPNDDFNGICCVDDNNESSPRATKRSRNSFLGGGSLEEDSTGNPHIDSKPPEFSLGLKHMAHSPVGQDGKPLLSTEVASRLKSTEAKLEPIPQSNPAARCLFGSDVNIEVDNTVTKPNFVEVDFVAKSLNSSVGNRRLLPKPSMFIKTEDGKSTPYPFNHRLVPEELESCLERSSADSVMGHLICSNCCAPSIYALVPFYSEDDFLTFRDQKEWLRTDLVIGFISLIAHRYHNPRIIHYANPYGGTTKISRANVNIDLNGVNSIIMMTWSAHHYAFIQVFLQSRSILITDGLSFPVSCWVDHIMECLKHHGLVPTSSRSSQVLDTKNPRSPFLYSGISQTASGKPKWNVSYNHLVVQHDSHSCGVYACMEAWKVLSEGSVVSSGNVMEDRKMVIDEYRKLLRENNIRRYGNIEIVTLSQEEELPATEDTMVEMIDEDSNKTAPESALQGVGTGVAFADGPLVATGKSPSPVQKDTSPSETNEFETLRQHTSIQKRKQKMMAEVKLRSRQDRQIEYHKKIHSESKHVTPGSVVVVRVPKEQRSRTSSQGILGLVWEVSKQYSILVVTQYGVIASGQPKQPLWVSVDNYEVKTFNVTMIGNSLARKFNQIMVGNFNANQEPLISLAEAHSKMMCHDFVGVRICKCRGGCKKGCSCRRNNSSCGSGCGCGGKCAHTLKLSELADDNIKVSK